MTGFRVQIQLQVSSEVDFSAPVASLLSDCYTAHSTVSSQKSEMLTTLVKTIVGSQSGRYQAT